MVHLKRIAVLCFSLVMLMSFAHIACAENADKVNINKASVEQLCTLKNIGPACAERIVQYRQQNGPFQNPEDLMKVKGVGPKTFDKIKDNITVQ